MKMKSAKIIFISILITLSSCATTSMVTQDIALGMTTQEVLSKAGKPFSKSVYKDAAGNVIDEWSYKETTWDDGGWSWDKTIINTVVIFENSKVKSFGNAGERFKAKNPMAPCVNIDNTIRTE